VQAGYRSVVDRLEELEDGSDQEAAEILRVWEKKMRKEASPLHQQPSQAPVPPLQQPLQTGAELEEQRDGAKQPEVNGPTVDTVVVSEQSSERMDVTEPGILGTATDDQSDPALASPTVEPVSPVAATAADTKLALPNGQAQHHADMTENESDEGGAPGTGSGSGTEDDDVSQETSAKTAPLNIVIPRHPLPNGVAVIPSLSSLSADSLRRRRSVGSGAGSQIPTPVKHAISDTESETDADVSGESSDDTDTDDGENDEADTSVSSRMVRPSQRKQVFKTQGKLAGW
jgi:hypothetical protein